MILYISGSNIKKNCYNLLKDLKGEGDTLIALADKNIHYCLGCISCINNLEEYCVIDDDMREILEKMVNADVIVMATPVYFFTMSGQMKMLIDRTTPRFSEIKDKEFYFIFTAATPNEKHLVNVKREFKSYLNCLTNPTNKAQFTALVLVKWRYKRKKRNFIGSLQIWKKCLR